MSGLVVGSLGASRIADAVARTRNGWGASRDNIMAELIAERLNDAPYPSYTNGSMQWGTETEPFARTAYEFYANATVTLTEPIINEKIPGSHASPDGLVGDEGLIEIKCPNTATHLELLYKKPIAEKYIKQMQWQMAVTRRKWCDFVSFDPRLPEYLRLFVKRVPRDDDMIEKLEKEVVAFLSELEAKLEYLRQNYGKQEAA